MSGNRDTNGFSLLEVLVALALTATIATMIVAVTTQLHPLRRIQAKYDVQKIADDLSQVIANDVSSALRLPLPQSENQPSMIGSIEQIRFVGVVKTGFRTEGLREVVYLLQPNSDGTRTLMRKTVMRRFGKIDDPAFVRTDNVFDPVQSLVFQYLDRDEEGKMLAHDSWDNASLPRAVKITLALPGIHGSSVSRTVGLSK